MQAHQRSLALCQFDVAVTDANPVALSGFSCDLMHSEIPATKALVIFSWLLRNPDRLTEIISEHDQNQLSTKLR